VWSDFFRVTGHVGRSIRNQPGIQHETEPTFQQYRTFDRFTWLLAFSLAMLGATSGLYAA
jgi:hypothetical protein